MLPIIGQTNDVSNNDDRRFKKYDTNNKKRSQNFGKTVDKPEGGLHQRVEDIRPGQVIVVDERQKRDQNQFKTKTNPVHQIGKRSTLIAAA
jgi:hypothetical protein